MLTQTSPSVPAPAPVQAVPPSAVSAAGPARPAFDVVRVEPDGRTVLAGRAAPGATVTIRDGDKDLGQVTADSRGEWVLMPDEPLAPGARDLRLSAVNPDGSRQDGAGSVTLVVPEARTSGALAVLTPDAGASRVLQAPAVVGGGKAPPSVTLDTIDYDRDGRVSIGGQARPGSDVLVYLDNGLVGRTRADREGRWTLTPDRLFGPGHYDLRADQVGADGKVSGRAEVAFDRAAIAETAAGGKAVVVLPGNNLWTIARRSYGEGPRYTLIFQANEAQIRDPNLIYPGQIFLLPNGEPS